MKLEKAIELLSYNIGMGPDSYQSDFLTAEKLGVEAMKREQLLRHEIPYDREGLLPGETEE